MTHAIAETETTGMPKRHVFPHLIRILAVPIILFWVAFAVVVNVIAPQLEVVGESCHVRHRRTRRTRRRCPRRPAGGPAHSGHCAWVAETLNGSMRPALETTSVPAWAIHAAPTPDADLSGRYWTVVALDDPAQFVVTDWLAQITARHPNASVRIHRVADDAAGLEVVTADLSDAVVGWRLMIAGPAAACLRLRAYALQRGVGDDEIIVASTTVAARDVHCAHCGTVSRAGHETNPVDLEDVVSCAGCGRELLVHYHVSRRLGAHLGFAGAP